MITQYSFRAAYFHYFTISLTESRNPVNGRSFLPSHQIQATGFIRSNKPLNTFSMKTLHTHEQRPARILHRTQGTKQKNADAKIQNGFPPFTFIHYQTQQLSVFNMRTSAHTRTYSHYYSDYSVTFSPCAKRVVSTAQHIAVYRFLFVRL